ncbi:MAG TPA: MFS transporter [Stellaceae bacterium]|nr:MFS transporter [Stellaceae bacterium]
MGEAMSVWSELKSLDRSQRGAVIASFLGWTLDAFDFFLMVVVLDNIADDFHTKVSVIAQGLFWTLVMRPVGAFIFGWIADRYGRRPTLMIDILLYAIVEFASAFAPDITTLLILRAIFGICMGGEWGVGSSLVMESIPVHTRGTISGFLQEGYAVGYLLAALVYWAAFQYVGWRGMFMIGAVPALLVVYIRMSVKESPAFEAKGGHSTEAMIRTIGREWKLVLYIIAMMSCFNAFSHGTQDLYKTFLVKQHGFDTGTVSSLLIALNLGAIVGGLSFGTISEYIGRRHAIVIAALLALPIIPLWAYSTTPLMLGLGAFLMQISVQGAWGIVPVHLNELTPASVRGTIPGFTYQIGNAVIASLSVYQSRLAESRGDDYAFALAATTAGVAILLSIVVWFGTERKGVSMTAEAAE